MAPLAPEAGNTKQLPQRISASKRWSFTYFYEKGSNGYDLLIEEFKKINANYIIGKEVCPTTGKEHLQGYVEFADKIRPLENGNFKKLKIHWEKSKGNRNDNIIYCSKENNYISTFIMKKPLIDPLAGFKLRPFQKKVIDLISEEPNNRTIHWFWDDNGNSGKTSLAKHLCIHYPNSVLFVNGAGKDIKYAVSEFISNEDNYLKICIFYFTRSVENFISYEAIESVKDGIVFNTKYESKMSIFNSPHVVCMANFEPDYSSLSADRWNVSKVD